MAETDNNPGGQTLNERLRRAAELARQRSGETTPPPPPPPHEPRKTPAPPPPQPTRTPQRPAPPAVG